VADVAADTITIRSLDWDRPRFDIEFALQEGTTYNSYLIFGPEKTALVDASHEKFRGLYMKTLNAELATRGRQIDYVLVSHTEPDHSGACVCQPTHNFGVQWEDVLCPGMLYSGTSGLPINRVATHPLLLAPNQPANRCLLPTACLPACLPARPQAW
jgi:hypothetical protein